MELRVVGCHGGETPRHRTSAFVVDERLAIDAGSLTSGLDLKAQFQLSACIISHAHLDHIRDLATIADNRCQADCEPLVVAATKETLAVLKKHFVNNLIWPDFSVIPNRAKPTIQYLELKPEKRVEIAGYQVRSVMVNHTIESAGFIVEGKDATIAYSGDTGPTDRMWEMLEPSRRTSRRCLMEVSFPNREQKLATVSGHHTPRTLIKDLKKYVKPQDLADALLYHIKPVFQGAGRARDPARPTQRREPDRHRTERSVRALSARPAAANANANPNPANPCRAAPRTRGNLRGDPKKEQARVGAHRFAKHLAARRASANSGSSCWRLVGGSRCARNSALAEGLGNTWPSRTHAKSGSRSEMGRICRKIAHSLNGPILGSPQHSTAPQRAKPLIATRIGCG